MPDQPDFAPTKAIFDADFHWGRPGSAIGFGAKASPAPQSFPRDFIEAAINAGVARPVPAAAKAANPAAPAAPARKD